MAESVFTAAERPIDVLIIKEHDLGASRTGSVHTSDITIAANSKFVTSNDVYANITYNNDPPGNYTPVAIVGWQLNGTNFENCVLTYVRFGQRFTNSAQVHFCIKNFSSSSVKLTSINLRVLWCKQ